MPTASLGGSGGNVISGGLTLDNETLTYASAPADVAGAIVAYADSTNKVLTSINDIGVSFVDVEPSTAPAGDCCVGLNAQGQLLYGSASGLVPAIPIMRNWIDGFIVTNDVTNPNTVLDVGPGQAADSTNAVLINNTATTFTKSTAGPWAAGSGAAGLASGVTLTANTWYYGYAIIVSGAFDFYIDSSLTAANKPAGTTAFRLVYLFKTAAASTAILPISQNPNDPDEFLWATPHTDVNYTAGPASSTAVTISVPFGVVVNALFNVDGFAASYWGMSFTTPSIASTAMPVLLVSTGNFAGALLQNDDYASGAFNIRTNTLSQIQIQSFGTPNYLLVTYGWRWRRGRQ